MTTTIIMPEKEKIESTPEYLAQLLKDKKTIATMPSLFQHAERLLDDEISRVRATLFQVTSGVQDSLVLPEVSGAPVQLSEKLFVPSKEYPE
ncbi:KH domain-containing RNA-binding protein QKI-like, partial [Saccoglossus kowalevskii]|uniref:Protein held out wings-like n=1 Tax=Saccoglossus kowalevskii TaxID=10224 RepID=A0ABM0MMD3_SACKO